MLQRDGAAQVVHTAAELGAVVDKMTTDTMKIAVLSVYAAALVAPPCVLLEIAIREYRVAVHEGAAGAFDGFIVAKSALSYNYGFTIQRVNAASNAAVVRCTV